MRPMIIPATLVLLPLCQPCADAQAVRSFMLKCYEMPNKPALRFDETEIAAMPKCTAKTVKIWRSLGLSDTDKRLAMLPVKKCVMTTETGAYICERDEGCGRFSPPAYRATKTSE